MKTVIIIPARYSSVRFPGKPLVKISIGRGFQKSLIQLSWRPPVELKTWNTLLWQLMTKEFELKRNLLVLKL